MAKAAKTKTESGPSLAVVSFGQGDATTALAAAGATVAQHQVHMIPVENLRVKPGYNMRVTGTPAYEAKIERFTASMLSEGYLPNKPLSAVAGKDGDADLVFVTDGHGRLEALARANKAGAGIEAVPVILKPADTSDIDLTVALITENDGEKPSTAEAAVVVKRLAKAKVPEEEIARRLSFSVRYVQDLLVLIAAPKGVRELVKQGRVSGTEAIRVLRRDPENAEEKLRKAVDTAESRGAVRATRKDTEEGSRGAAYAGGVKLARAKIEWAVTEGQEFALSEVKPFAKLIGDTDWYSLLGDKPGTATATEDLRFQAIVTRPRKEKVEDAPPKKVKRGKAVASEIVDEEDGALGEVEDVIGGTPVEDSPQALAAAGAEDSEMDL